MVGISWAFLDEINQTASVEGKHEEQADFSGETGNTKLSVVIISVGIIAVVLQLIISVGFWYWKEKVMTTEILTLAHKCISVLW